MRTRQTITIGAAIAITAVAVTIGLRHRSDPGQQDRSRESPTQGSGTRLTALRPDSPSDPRLAREVASLSLGQVLEQLPGEPLSESLSQLQRDPRIRLLYRRLGALLGGEAIAEIGSRWGSKPQAQGLSLYGMGQALAGWMEADPQSASEGLIEFARGIEYIGGHAHIHWNGESFEFESDFAVFSVGQALGEALRAATESDPNTGMALLMNGDFPWDESLLSSYTRGLGRDTDWAEVEQQLEQLAAQRGGSRGESNDVSLAVGQGWAQRDLDAALIWYLENTTTERDDFARAYSLIRTLEDPDGERVANWMEDRMGTGILTDEFVDQFIEMRTGRGGSDQFDHLIALPSDESVRERILSRLATPLATSGGEPFLAYSPETLFSFIEAARLSPDAEAHWRSVVEKNQHLPRGRASMGRGSSRN